MSSFAKFIYKYSCKICFNELYFSESIISVASEKFEFKFTYEDPTYKEGTFLNWLTVSMYSVIIE